MCTSPAASPAARSLMLRGRRTVFGSVNALSWHFVTVGRMILRRSFPIGMTSGMFVPDGAFMILNLPSAPLSAAATGVPEIGESQRSHDAPVAIGPSAVFGTYSSTLYSGFLPAGSNTWPLIVVPAPLHSPGLSSWHCRFVHGPGPDDGQTWSVRQAMPLSQVPQSIVLPQLSPTTPQYWPPIGLQLRRFVHLVSGGPQ